MEKQPEAKITPLQAVRVETVSDSSPKSKKFQDALNLERQQQDRSEVHDPKLALSARMFSALPTWTEIHSTGECLVYRYYGM